MKRFLKFVLFSLAGLAGIVCILGLLFVINGVWLSNGETPRTGLTSQIKTELKPFTGTEIKVVSYNIAKGFIHKGGVSFENKDVVLNRLRKIAKLIITEQPDLVFLSETMFECGPCPVNQVTMLAELTGMQTWAFGENYNIGFPFYRIAGGNAILSRWPIHPVANPSLVGRKPFYVTKNNRRVLWCEMFVNGTDVLLGAIHTDSYMPKNNLAQTQQILEYIGDRPAIIAGDFNANPHEPSIQLVKSTGHFSGVFNGPLTFPTHKPSQTIDFIFAPASWELFEHRVIQNDASDHLPITSTFRLSPL